MRTHRKTFIDPQHARQMWTLGHTKTNTRSLTHMYTKMNVK